MIKIFIPQIKGKIKTSVRGFWRNTEDRTFYDYLRVIEDNLKGEDLLIELEALKRKYNQEAIAYIDTATNCLKIYYNRDKIEVLRHCISWECLAKNELKTTLKKVIKKYNGSTVYIDNIDNEIFYTIVAYYK